MNNNKLSQVIDHVINLEGLYGNDPLDSGGQTKYGITEQVARANGYTDSMRDLPLETAKFIYANEYILKPKLDKVYDIDSTLGLDLIDFGINQGVVVSVRLLQRWLNALNDGTRYYQDQVVDGKIGPSTLGQLNQFIKQRGSVEVLLLGIRCSQGTHYLEITEKYPKNERFLYGWIKNRV